MRIERLVLKEVGPFDDLDITFSEGKDPDRADIYMFVGPNGSGKSTLLYALASAFGPAGHLLTKRLRGPDSGVALRADSVWVFTNSLGKPNAELLKLFSKSWSKRLQDWDFEKPLFTAFDNDYKDKKGPQSAQFHISVTDLPIDYKTDYAAFGYSAKRTVEHGVVGQIKEYEFNPFAGALDFSGSGQGEVDGFVQWLANTITKKALALMRGADAEAERRQASLTRLEQVLSDITGLTLKFAMAENTLAIQMSMSGTWMDLEVLPEGLKSILSWLSDLLMRLENIPWKTDEPLTERAFMLFLDEIEVHLHPKWQRRLLPTLQVLFPNAQIFLATHSPFIVASANDAYIYPISLDEQGKASIGEVLTSRVGHSYPAILEEVFGVSSDFDLETERRLDAFRALRTRRLQGEDVDAELQAMVAELSKLSTELRDIMALEMRSLKRKLDGKT